MYNHVKSYFNGVDLSQLSVGGKKKDDGSKPDERTKEIEKMLDIYK